MRTGKGLPIVALAMMGVGFLGMVATSAMTRSLSTGPRDRSEVVRSERRRAPADGFSSNGERIYYTGAGRDGPIAVEWNPGFGGGMMGRRGGTRLLRMRPACVRCHRSDGRGGSVRMMGWGAVAPDIRYDTLTSGDPDAVESATSTVEAGWSDAEIARAIREGVEPDGEELDPVMPRWRMDRTDMRDTIDYLKELSNP